VSGITTVGVLGGGLMGAGIAEVSARTGHVTILREVSGTLCERARASITRSLNRAIDKGKATAAERDAALERIRFTTAMGDLAPAQIVVEAVVEDLTVKAALFRELDTLVTADAVLASNTSSLSITEIAAGTAHPDRILGLHFFNPVPVMKLVEVVRAIGTSDAAFERASEFARALGKEPITARDRSGFIVNLLLVPYMLDAIRALENGAGSVAEIDAGMTLGAGHPMGPFTLLDFVGLDTTCRIAEIMFAEYREPRYAPPPLLRRMVVAGMYGRKSGRGFYDYSRTPPRPARLGL